MNIKKVDHSGTSTTTTCIGLIPSQRLLNDAMSDDAENNRETLKPTGCHLVSSFDDLL